MADAKIKFRIDKESIRDTLDEIEDRLRDGAKKGLHDTLSKGQDVAQAKIKAERNPFTAPHLSDSESFSTFIYSDPDSITGYLNNHREHAAYVDQGVSGTETKRPNTQFSYTDDKPPLQKLIPWVEKYLTDWDIDTDPDPPFDFGGGGTAGTDTDIGEDKYYRPLSEYDVDDIFDKERIERTDQLFEDLVFVFDNGDNVFEARVLDISDGVVTYLYAEDLENQLYPDEDWDIDIIARESRTTVNEISKGDEVIFREPALHDHTVDRQVYGEFLYWLEDDRGREYGVIRDSFLFARNINVYKESFIGTREDKPDIWGQDVNFAEPVDGIPEGLLRIDNFTDDYLETLYRKKEEVAVNIDGSLYTANIRPSRHVDAVSAGADYAFEIGQDIDGEHLSFGIDEASDLDDLDVEIVAVPKKAKRFQNLEDGQFIIADVEDVLDNDRWGIDSHTDNTLVRGKVKVSDPDGLRRKVTFQTLQAPNKAFQLNYDNFVGTRDDLSGAWSAKDLDVGDTIRVETFDGVKTGYYAPTRNERNKIYNLGNIQFYDPEEEYYRRVKDIDVIERTNENISGAIQSLPDEEEILSNLPDDYQRIDTSLTSDFEDKEYIGWSFRDGEFVTVKPTRGVSKWETTLDSDNVVFEQVSSEFFADEKLFPVEIVGEKKNLNSEGKYFAEKILDQIDVVEEAKQKTFQDEDDNELLFDLGTRNLIETLIENETDIPLDQWKFVEKAVGDWKNSTKPSNLTGEEKLFIKGLIEVNGIEGAARDDIPDSIDEKTYEAVETFTELSRKAMKELGQSDDFPEITDQKMTVTRGMQRHQVAPLAKKMFENPQQDEYTIDDSAIRSYSTEDMGFYSRGLFHSKEINHQEKLVAMPDLFFSKSWRENEKEVLLQYGDDSTYDVNNLVIGEDTGTFDDAQSAFSDAKPTLQSHEFVTANLEGLHDDTIKSIGKLVKNLINKEKEVDDELAAARLWSFYEAVEDSTVLDEDFFLPRNFSGTPEEAIEKITGRFGRDKYNFETEFGINDYEARGDLAEYGFAEGVGAADMEVHELAHYDPDSDSDEGLAIVSDYSDTGAKTSTGVREITAYTLVRNLAPETVAPHKSGGGDDLEWVAKEVIDGKMASKLDPTDELAKEVSREEFLKAISFQLFAGNFDAHGDNMLVSSDGELKMIDLDHSAGFLGSFNTGNKSWYDDALDRALGEAASAGTYLGMTDDGGKSQLRDEIRLEAESIAKELYDPATDTFDSEAQDAFSDIEFFDKFASVNAKENIKENIKLFATGNHKNWG